MMRKGSRPRYWVHRDWQAKLNHSIGVTKTPTCGTDTIGQVLIINLKKKSYYENYEKQLGSSCVSNPFSSMQRNSNFVNATSMGVVVKSRILINLFVQTSFDLNNMSTTNVYRVTSICTTV